MALTDLNNARSTMNADLGTYVAAVNSEAPAQDQTEALDDFKDSAKDYVLEIGLAKKADPSANEDIFFSDAVVIPSLLRSMISNVFTVGVTQPE